METTIITAITTTMDPLGKLVRFSGGRIGDSIEDLMQI
jgi:hypothetical protein